MSLAILYSRAQQGIAAPLVTVEVHLSGGLPGLSIVGLPETAVKESKDRVRAALLNTRFEFPARRITVNLAPADLPKEGGRYDLAIAIGILAASAQLPAQHLERYEFIGELALSGALRPVHGVLPAAVQCRDAQRDLILAAGNATEAALVSGLVALPASQLLDVCAHLCGEQPLTATAPVRCDAPQYDIDLNEVHGQPLAKRALEIAASGGHNLLMIGPPGTGKTMLAQRLPTILPALDEQEALETASISSISQQGFHAAHWRRRPFRSPHHSASSVALVGGGGQPAPGEISLAHNGVLFLDELPEFDRRVLEVLREPLESGTIHISRAARQAQFPARFQLIAAMNPCPCGYLGHPRGLCHCTSEQIARYRARVSGPLLDRIDMHLEVAVPPRGTLSPQRREEDSLEVRRRVSASRRRQLQRSRRLNAHLGVTELRRHCALGTEETRILEQACDSLGLSARAYQRILKVARTIADLAGHDRIARTHLLEALSYRRLDRHRQQAGVP